MEMFKQVQATLQARRVAREVNAQDLTKKLNEAASVGQPQIYDVVWLDEGNHADGPIAIYVMPDGTLNAKQLYADAFPTRQRLDNGN